MQVLGNNLTLRQLVKEDPSRDEELSLQYRDRIAEVLSDTALTTERPGQTGELRERCARLLGHTLHLNQGNQTFNELKRHLNLPAGPTVDHSPWPPTYGAALRLFVFGEEHSQNTLIGSVVSSGCHQAIPFCVEAGLKLKHTVRPDSTLTVEDEYQIKDGFDERKKIGPLDKNFLRADRLFLRHDKHDRALMALLARGGDVSLYQRNRSGLRNDSAVAHCVTPLLPPLFYAVAKGDLELCRALLDNGADVHATLESGVSLLHIAIQRNEAFIDDGQKMVPIVRLLLAKGVDLLRDKSGKAQFGRTAFQWLIHEKPEAWELEMLRLIGNDSYDADHVQNSQGLIPLDALVQKLVSDDATQEQLERTLELLNFLTDREARRYNTLSAQVAPFRKDLERRLTPGYTKKPVQELLPSKEPKPNSPKVSQSDQALIKHSLAYTAGGAAALGALTLFLRSPLGASLANLNAMSLLRSITRRVYP